MSLPEHGSTRPVAITVLDEGQAQQQPPTHNKGKHALPNNGRSKES